MVGKTGLLTLLIPSPDDAPLAEFLRRHKFRNRLSQHFCGPCHHVYQGYLAATGIGGLVTEFEDTASPTIK